MVMNGKMRGNSRDSTSSLAWEKVGIHRQVSSFFLNIITSFSLKIPNILVTVVLYARYIQPFVMINGVVSWASGIFASLFLVFELGTPIALSKFFAAHRVKNPAKAIQYAQIFTWWSLVISSLQATVMVILGLWYLPFGNQGGFTLFLVLSSVTQLPRCLGIVNHVLNASQRFDVGVKVNAILGNVVNTAISYACILAFRWLGSMDPRFGEAMGAGLGIYVASVINSLVSFVVFSTIFKRMGYSVSRLFMHDFSRAELREMLLFGGGLTIGNGFYGITSVIQSILISLFISGFADEYGAYLHVGNLTQFVGMITPFTSSLVPAISEAHAHGKSTLLEYYLVEGIKWSYFIMLYLAAVFLAIGGEFLAVSGEQWLPALKYVPWYVFFSCWWPMAWFVDSVFQGTGHPGYNTIVWLVEQGTRLVLLVIMLPVFKLFGLIFSYLPGIILKVVVSLAIIRKKIIAFHAYPLHVLFASLGGAVVVYIVFRFIGLVLGATRGNEWLTVLLFGAGTILGLNLHGFISGLLGGWDDLVLDEFAGAIAMSRINTMFFSPLVSMVRLGHRVCPWKNRFPVTICERAMQEASAITGQKVSLEI